MLTPIELSDRVRVSEAVFEGQIIESQGFMDPEGKMIHTAHLVRVFRVFKGHVPGDFTVVTVQGGVYGNQGLTVTPSLELKKDDLGLFIASTDPMPNPFTGMKAWRPFGTANGFIRYHVEDDLANEAFFSYQGIQTNLYAEVERLVGHRHEVRRDWLNKGHLQGDRGQTGETMTPSNITFVPGTITAGTFSILTISGNNFGVQGPNSRVRFRNADDGGATYITASNLHIVSWNDTQIRCIVPTRAGTGDIEIRSDASLIGVSAASLTVRYNIINTELPSASPTDIYHMNLTDLNNAGGFTFAYNNTRGSAGNNFAANADARAAFERALETWRCATGVNFSVSPTSTSADYINGADTINCVSFDYTGQFITALGVCFSAWTFPGACTIAGGRTGMKTRIDIVFRHPTDNPNWGAQTWHFLTTPPPANRFDFESVALHELGHGHELGHVNVAPGAGVMRFAIAPTTMTRTLTADDIAGGLSVMARSTDAAGMESCGRMPHQSVLGAPVCQQELPASPGTCSITASATTGCAPLTVNFTGNATGDVPTAWYWDLDNAAGPPTPAKIEYYSRTPSHTFSAPGTYVVKMYAGTANGYCQSTVTIDVGTSFVATLAPAGPVSTCGSQTLTATNDPAFTYQWFRDGNPVGSNQNTHVASVTGSYTVRVSQGSCILDLGPVQVTILPPSIGGTASANPLTVCAGTNSVDLSLSGQAGNVLRWEHSTDNFVTNTVNVPLSNSPNITVTNLPQTRRYRALVQNGICTAVYSSTIDVSVVPQTVGGAVGNNQTICSGTNTATLNLTGHTGSVLRWESSSDNFVTNTVNITNNGTSHTVNNLAATTWYRAVVQSGNCNIIESAAAMVQVDPSPPPIDPITGPATACQNTQSTFSTNNIAGVSYDWTINPAGPALVPSGNTVQVNWGTAASTTYTISVRPRIGGCLGSQQSVTAILNLAIGTPGSISGAGLHCVGQARQYSIAPVTGASTYNWSNSCAGWTGSSTATSINYTATAVQSCIISVTATGVCGTSTPAQLTVLSTAIPPQPSAISGLAVVCQNSTLNYSVNPIAGANLTWTAFSSQASILSGQGTNSITMTWGNTPPSIGPLCVRASNGCGNSSPSCIDVDVHTVPAQPAPITGSPALICGGTNFTYTTAPVSNVSYAWTVTPAGPTLVPNANQANVTWPASGVFDLEVVPSNFCGNGPLRRQRYTIEAQPVANAGADRVICAPSMVVAGTPATNGVWRCFSCPGAATLTNFGASALINGLEPGITYELEYEVRGQACPPTTDRMTVLNDAAASGTIVAPGNAVCGGSSVTLSLSGHRGTIVRWEYSTDNAASWTTIANQSTSLTFTPTVTTHFRALISTPSGNCPDVYTQPVFQRVVERPVATASPSFQQVCQSSATAYGVLPNAGSVSWSLVSAPPSASPTVSTAQGTGLFNNLTVPGVYRFRYTVQGEAPCGTDETTVDVERLPDAPAANAGLDGSSCDGTYQLQGNFVTGATMTWLFISGPDVPTIIPNQNTASVSGMNRPGRYVFTYSIKQGACPSSTDYIIITRTQPLTAFAGVDFATCNSSVLLRGNSPSPGVGNWTVVSHPGTPPTIQGTGQTVVAVLPSQTGPYVFRYEITGAPCTPVSDEITVTRDVMPQAPALAASTISLCGDIQVQLEALPHAIGMGVWSFLNGPTQASISGSGLVVTAANLTGVGTYAFRYTVSTACGSAYSDVTVSRSASIPQVFAGSDQTVCDVSSTLLTGSPLPTGATATWEFVGGPCLASVVGFGRFASAVSMTCAGDYFFRYTVTPAGSGCQPVSDVVKVTRKERPTVANITGPTTICGSTATLTGNIPTIGTGSWSLISTPTNGSATLNPLANVMTASGMTVPGTYVFRWTVSNPPCTPSAADHTVTVGQQAVGGTVSGPQSSCSASPLSHVLSNHQGEIVRWEVSTDGGSSWVPVSNTQPTLVTNPAQPGQYCYRAAVSGACGTVFSSVNCVNVQVPPIQANAGADLRTCNSFAVLVGNYDPNSGGLWQFMSGPAVPTLFYFGTSLSITGMTVPGIYCFQYELSNQCGTTTDLVCIEVLPQPVGGSVNGPGLLCRTSPNDVATLTLNSHAGQVLRWEYSYDGFVSVNAVPNTSTVFSLNGSYPNGFICVRAVVGQPECNLSEVYSQQRCVQLSNGNYPAPFAGADFTTCDPNVTLNGAAPPQGVTATWVFISGPMPASFSQTGPTTGQAFLPVFGHYVFRYTFASPGCPPKQDEIMVSYLDNQATGNGTVSGTTTVCGLPNSGTLNLTGHNGTIIRWESSTDNWVNITPYNNPTPVFNWNALTQTTQFRAVIANASCPTTYSLEATVYVAQPTTVAQAPQSITVCGDNTTLMGNTPTVGTGSWRFVFGPATPTVVGSGPTAFVTGLSAQGAYLFEYKIENPPCAPSTAMTMVQVYPAVITGAISTAQTVCSGTNQGTLTLQGHQGTIVRWESSTDNFGSQIMQLPVASTSFMFNNLQQTNCFRVVVMNNNCPPAYTQPVCVTVDPLNVGGMAVPAQQQICATSGDAQVSLSNHQGAVQRWEISTDGGITWTPAPNSATSVYTFTQLTQNALVRAVVGGGACPPVNSQAASIGVDAASVGGFVNASATVCAAANSGSLQLMGHTGTILRWEVSTDNFASATTINNPTATQVYTDLRETTQYRAVVQNGVCAPVFSTPAVISMDGNSLPGTLTGNTTVCMGNHTGLIELVGGNATVIRWERSADNFQSFETVATSGRSFTYSNLMQTMQYRVLVQAGNCPPVYTNVVTIFVQVGAIAGVVSAPASFCQTGTGVVQLIGGFGPIVRWEMSNDNFQQSRVPISNISSTHVYANLTQSMWIRVVQQAGSCPEVYSNAVKITIDQPAVGGTVSGGTTACNGSATGTLTLNNFSGAVVRWEKAPDMAFTMNVQQVPATTPTLNYNETQSVWYRAVVSGGACGEVFSAPAHIWVLPAGQGGAVTGATTVCHDAGSGTLDLLQSVGTVLRWERSTDCQFTNMVTIPNATTQLTYSGLTETTCYRAVVSSGGVCPPVYSTPAQITVLEEIVVNVVETSEGCNGLGTIRAEATGGNGPFTYTIQPAVQPPNGSGLFNNLPIGAYTINVSDGLCTASVVYDLEDAAPAPLRPTVSQITATSALVQWVAVPPVAGMFYTLRYRTLNAPSWSIINNIGTNFFLLSGLQAGTPYEVQVAYRCPSSFVNSAFSLSANFTTLTSRDEALAADAGQLRLYPNPNRGRFAVELTAAEGGSVRLSLTDLQGRVLRVETRQAEAGRNEWAIEAGDLASGVYLLRVDGVGFGQSLKVVVE